MTSTLDVAQAIAPGWERRRPFIEQVTAPVRAWLIRELRPQPGGTVLELRPGPATPASRRPPRSASAGA